MGIILASLFVKHIVKDNISEGVTRVLYAISKTGSRIRGHNCYTSMVGGAVTIGFGGSVGPEAPIVLTGAAIGSNVGRIARLNYKHTTLLLSAPISRRSSGSITVIRRCCWGAVPRAPWRPSSRLPLRGSSSCWRC